MISNNLLRITTTNAKMDYNMRDAKVSPERNNPATVTRKMTPAKLECKVKDAFVNIDTTEAQSSLDIDKMERFAQKKADEAYQKVMKGIEERVSIGNQIGRLHEGATVAAVYKNKFVSDELQCQTTVRFLPSAPAEITVDPVKVDVNNTPGKMDADWKAHQFSLGYTPAHFENVLTQKSNVDIEYMGDHQYV